MNSYQESPHPTPNRTTILKSLQQLTILFSLIMSNCPHTLKLVWLKMHFQQKHKEKDSSWTKKRKLVSKQQKYKV